MERWPWLSLRWLLLELCLTVPCAVAVPLTRGGLSEDFDTILAHIDPKVACASSLVPGGEYEKDMHGTEFDNTTFLCRNGTYLTAYDLSMRLPLYSAYFITPAEAGRERGGRHRFLVDPVVPLSQQPPVESPCWSQLWNRGHLCPSYIMSYDKNTTGPWEETYLITNAAMQFGPRNKGTWKALEDHVVAWIRSHHRSLYIVTGTGLASAGRSRIWASTAAPNLTTCDLTSGQIESGTSRPASWMVVPDFYYKALCDLEAGRSIAYMGDNHDDSDVRTVSVDMLTSGYTHLRLFPPGACGTGVADLDWFADSR
mmetsp:Transcript_95404/g.274753  ORF Transcript_95404/g.274753 Transcript_95404/m.274753 type:complete len:312 (+) Transcript_95404:79-1014(+)